MRVLFLTEGTTIPSTRFRVLQFLPYFEANGVQCTARGGYGEQYNSVSRTKWGKAYKLASRLKRAALGVDAPRFDGVFLQRPAIPFTSVPERLLGLSGTPVIFDFDDNLSMGANGQPHGARQRTLSHAARSSDHVIAGNAFLAGLVDAPDKLSIIPTVLDTNRYTPGPSPFASPDVVIGWMGTKGNFVYVREILPDVLATLDAYPNARFRVVSNALLPELADHPQVDQIPWSAEDEIDLLRSFDIGLMPLADTLGARGKCGFKMIQYMAVGAAVVSSPVGANVDIFEGSGAGHLASDSPAWRAGLAQLIEDDAHRAACGEAARAHAAAHYSIEGVLPTYLSLFERVYGA